MAGTIHKRFYAGVLSIISAFVFLTAGCDSDETDDTPDLPKPEMTAALSDTSPSSDVIITWKQAGDADGYVVTRTAVRDGITNISKLQWERNSPLTLTDSGCDPDTEYTYVLTAIASGKYRSYEKDSEPVIIKTQKSSVPMLDFPKGLKAATVGEPNTLTFSWNPVYGASEYEVYRMDGGYKYWDNYFTLDTTTAETSYTVKYACNEEIFVFRVRAKNGEKYSPYSAKIEGRVAEAENLTQDKALLIENNVWRNFYADSGVLWYKCTPVQGRIYSDGFSAQTFTVSIYSEDGTLLAENLSLFIDENGNPISVPADPRGSSAVPKTVFRDITGDITGFKSGDTLLLKVTKPEYESIGLMIE
ncbi:MAG: hypothetical protein J6Z17_04570 [Treponema sp.]|nr:hypothetical protein [Treponema sp.]